MNKERREAMNKERRGRRRGEKRAVHARKVGPINKYDLHEVDHPLILMLVTAVGVLREHSLARVEQEAVAEGDDLRRATVLVEIEVDLACPHQ